MAKDHLAELGFTAEDGASWLFFHNLAVLHSPAYRVENVGALLALNPELNENYRRITAG